MKNTTLFALLFSLHGNLWAQAPQYPLEAFAKLPQYNAPIISPDGRKLAATVIVNGKPFIYIKNRDEPTKIYPPIESSDTHFSRYVWGNNDRLIIGLRGTTKIRSRLFNYQRLVSTRYDGSAPIGYKMEADKYGYFLQFAWPVGQNKQDKSHMLMALDGDNHTFNTPVIHLVNLETGEKKLIEKNGRDISHWIADNHGKLRIGIRYKDSNRDYAIFYRETETTPWQELQKVKLTNNDRLEAYDFAPDDNNILLVSTDQLEDAQERGTPGLPNKLFRYNLTTRKIEGEYIDEIFNRVKATAQKALPGYTINIISYDDNKEVYTLSAFSDDKPEIFFLYDRKLKTMDLIGSAYPQLENAQLAKMQKVEYPARDKYKIPAFLTLPTSPTKNLPFIIFVHGGPWASDTWGFNHFVQFFANRGYGVLQPQFRGSTGYGIAHKEAGFGQWGRLIQDDISDGVSWVIDQGMADPKRICIVGGSFGGYAAAVGLAKTPELYKCGISLNGVMDLEKLYNDMGRFAAKNANRDLFNDSNNLKPDSPLHLASQIRAPLLLLAGTKDTVVPFEHSTSMRDKLEELKKPVTFVELKDGEHWLTIDKNQIDAFKAVETFLAQNLGART